MRLATFARLPCLIVLAVTACSPSKSSAPGTDTALSIVTTSLPSGTVGAAYAAQLASDGGTSPISWSLSGGSSLPPGLALDGAAGNIKGTPSTTGTFDFAVAATDSADPPHTATANLSITVEPEAAALTVTTTLLPDARVDATYAATLEAAGGTAPYSWSLVDGFLPPGITLAPDGSLSGTPTVAGSYSATFQVTDGSTPAKTATATIGLTAMNDGQSLEIFNYRSMPGGAVGSPFYMDFLAWGGNEPYVWSVASGALPPGLFLDAAGTLSGTPTAPGSYTFVLQVTDSSNPQQFAQQQFTIDVFTGPLSITTVSLPDGVIGTPYAWAVAANGGATPYAWTVSVGALPTGLALDGATGAIAGTPTEAGSYAFTVRASDSSNPTKTASQDFKVSIASASNELNITTTAFPDGVTGVPYSMILSASGGTTPYAWSTSGSLPSGLTLDPATGVVAGTPAATGTSNFTVKVTDSSTPTRNWSRSFKINMYAPLQAFWGFPTVWLPFAVVNSPYSSSAGGMGGDPPYYCSLLSGSVPPGLSLNADCSVVGTPTEVGGWVFSIQLSDSANPCQTISFNASLMVMAGPL